LPFSTSIRDILSAYPYPNTLVVLHMRYTDVKRYLEQCAAYFAIEEDGTASIARRYLVPKAHHYHYDHLYGLEYEVDLKKPEVGRVGRIFRESDGKEVTRDDELDICFTSYRASGIGGFGFLKSLPVVREIRTQVRSLIISYFRHHPLIEVDPRCRVRFAEEPRLPSNQP
ncbi:MAG: 5'-nucleotidase C-terminal domain-containing protein, partial [Clostridia bacterium]|nr:5'-nucleotidase C-terminal domain-containing protein [Clostridia bacterium]